MKQVLTVSCKLQVTPEQSIKVDATLQAFANACEYVNQTVPPTLTNELAMQSLVYHKVRDMFGLSAQLAIHAIRRVSGNRKTAKKDGSPVIRFAPTSVTYDTRIFSFREKDWTVSLTTTGGRERFVLLSETTNLDCSKVKTPRLLLCANAKMVVTILIFSLNLSHPSLHQAIKFWAVIWVGLILRSLRMEIHLAANKLPKLETIMPS